MNSSLIYIYICHGFNVGQNGESENHDGFQSLWRLPKCDLVSLGNLLISNRGCYICNSDHRASVLLKMELVEEITSKAVVALLDSWEFV